MNQLNLSCNAVSAVAHHIYFLNCLFVSLSSLPCLATGVMFHEMESSYIIPKAMWYSRLTALCGCLDCSLDVVILSARLQCPHVRGGKE